MSELTKEQLQTLQHAFEAWPAPWEEEDTEIVRPALRALLDAYEERGREVERLRAERDEWKRIAYVETHGNRCVWQEKFEQAGAEVERLRAERDRFQKIVHAVSPVLDPAALGKDAEGFGSAAYHIRERAERAEERMAKVVEALARYGDHEYGCSLKAGGDRCTCGFNAALAGAQPEEESR